MGSSSNESNSLIVIMKYLAILAIALFAVVAAEPEAEADAEAAAAYYGGYYGHPYRYGYGLGGYYGGYYGHRFGYGLGYRHFGKREAEADPALVYAHAYAPYAAYPYAAYAPYYYRAPASSSFQHVSTPAATYGLSQLHKRSADAEPEADAAAAYYGGYYGHPGYYGYGYGYGL